MVKRGDHAFHLHDLAAKSSDLGLCQLLDVRAVAAAVPPKGQKFANCFNLKPQIAGAADEAEHLDIGAGIGAVARWGAPS